MTSGTKLVVGSLAAGLLILGMSCGSGGDDGFGSGGGKADPPQNPKPVDDTGEDTGLDSAEDTGSDDTADTGADTVDTSLGLEGEGYDRGDVAFNLVAPNQDDQTWKLYQQLGEVVVLVFGAAYDPQMTEISGFLNGFVENYDIVVVAMLVQDSGGTQADDDDATAWAEAFDLETVIYDPVPTYPIMGDWAPQAQSEPRVYLIDESMTIDWTNDGATDEVQLENKIKDLVF
jgi:hypothetical protein